MTLPFLSTPGESRHTWKFHRFGGVDQVVFRDAADLEHLPELDLKLWMALSVPTSGLQFDVQTSALIDHDHDGRIHPPELLAAVRWACDALNDPALLLHSMSQVPISAIKDPALAASARHVLNNLGKGNAEAIALGDVTDRARIFAQTLFNGDGVVPPEAAGQDQESETLLREIVATLGGVMDRSGRPGVDSVQLAQFYSDAAAFIAWSEQAAHVTIPPLGLDAMDKAVAALRAVGDKLDDYFARCRLATFDERAIPALNRDASDYRALSVGMLRSSTPEVAEFPLATIAPDQPLPLRTGLNPAWCDAMETFVRQVVDPLLDTRVEVLTEKAWRGLQNRLAPYERHCSSQPASKVGTLGVERLRAILAGNSRRRVEELIHRDLELKPESTRIATVEKLVRFCRDLPELLTNSVNFADFYGRTDAVFQVGKLYIDGRACSLCVEVTDESRHAALAGLSGLFLAYCELARPDAPRRKIVAAVTDGDCDNLMVGRNGLFQDRQDQLWDATITKIVSAPISVRQAFWLPYKKFVRMIEDQIAKRAQAADETATTKFSSSVEKALDAEPGRAAPAPGTPPKKLELGTIALIGTAIGGISALVGGFLKALFGLGFWLPLGVVGIVLLISGPSMLLASLKLRRRNLAPLLDANGWAINTQARVNIPFGAALTKLATLPPGTIPSLYDPFEERKRPWKRWLVLAAILGLATAWLLGRLDRHLPGRFQRCPAAAAPASTGDSPLNNRDDALTDPPSPAT